MKPTLAILGARGLGASLARPVAPHVRRRFLMMIAAGRAVHRTDGPMAPDAPSGAPKR